MRLQSASCAGSTPAPVSLVKRLGETVALVGIVALVAFLVMSRIDVVTARAESARLRRANDSLAVLSARVDTVYSRDTTTLWRVKRSTDTLTQTVEAWKYDTIRVVEYVARADSTIQACVATVLTCEARVAVRDSRIAVLDSLNRATEQRLTRERRIGWRDKALAVGLGYLVGRLTP